MSKTEDMFVLTPDGKGKWERYNDRWDITIHCRSEEDHNRVLTIIRRAADLLKEEKNAAD